MFLVGEIGKQSSISAALEREENILIAQFDQFCDFLSISAVNNFWPADAW